MKRTKQTAIALLSLILFASCQKQEFGTDSHTGEIRFATGVAGTRGDAITDDAGANPLLDMGVFLFHTTAEFDLTATPNYGSDIKISRPNTSTAWDYATAADTRYWVPNGFHTFLAYAPHGAATPHTWGTPWLDSPDLSLDFTLAPAVVDHVDLLYSSSSHFNKTHAADRSNRINFTMAHALTKITFEATLGTGYATSPNGSAGLTCKVKSISIKNTTTESSLKYTMTNSGSGIDAVSGATWINDAQYTVSDITAYSGPTAALITADLSTTPQLLSQKPAFFIPQKIDGRTDGLTPTLVATFEFSNGEIRLKEFPLPAVTPSWSKGQAIRYQIIYNGDGIIPSSLMATILPWNDQDIDGLRSTYLNVNTNKKQYPYGTTATLYFATDYPGTVTATLNGTTTITPTVISPSNPNSGSILIPDNLDTGTHTLRITAGSIIRNVTLIVANGLLTVVFPWEDQPVDERFPATYLNLSKSSITLTPASYADVNLYYTTDYTGSVTATLNGSPHTTGGTGYFTIPAGLVDGPHTLRVTAGKLTRTLAVQVGYTLGDYFPDFNNPATAIGIVYTGSAGAYTHTGTMISMDQNSSLRWKTNTGTTAGTTEDTNGMINMNAAKAADPTLADHPAFKYCNDKGAGVWYLPAKNQLSSVYSQMTLLNTRLTTAGDTTFDTFPHWSATENTADSSWGVGFGAGSAISYTKASTNRVRCVRDF